MVSDDVAEDEARLHRRLSITLVLKTNETPEKMLTDPCIIWIFLRFPDLSNKNGISNPYYIKCFIQNLR